MRTINSGKGQSIETSMTNEEAAALVERIKNNSFAESILYAFKTYKNLTEPRAFWLHKLAQEQLARETGTAKPEINFPKYEKIIAFFERVSNGAITLKVGVKKIRFKLAGVQSKYPGNLWVTDGQGYGGEYYGRIDLEGEFHPSRDCKGEVAEFVKEAMAGFDSDPATYAGEYGRRTGHCCFCNTEITNEASLKVGYGPWCARVWNLPHSYSEKTLKRIAKESCVS